MHARALCWNVSVRCFASGPLLILEPETRLQWSQRLTRSRAHEAGLVSIC